MQEAGQVIAQSITARLAVIRQVRAVVQVSVLSIIALSLIMWRQTAEEFMIAQFTIPLSVVIPLLRFQIIIMIAI